MGVALRPVQAADADALFPLIYQSPVTATLAWDGPDSIEEYRQSLEKAEQAVAQGERHLFTILAGDPPRPVGSISIRPDARRFRADIGLWVGLPYQGRGYGTHAIRQAVVYGFEQLGLVKIDAYIFVGNRASRRAFEHNGFLLEGTLRRALPKHGRPVDEWMVGLTRDDYLTAQAEWITHILPAADWQAAQQAGAYEPPSLAQEGFIHFSRPEQVLATANRYYAGQAGLLLLWVDPRRLQAELRWEPAGDELFPHLYGPLNLDAVQAAGPFEPGPDGVFRKLPSSGGN